MHRTVIEFIISHALDDIFYTFPPGRDSFSIAVRTRFRVYDWWEASTRYAL